MRRAVAACFFLWFALSASAQERTHDITPEDYASVNTITEIAVSPDGKQVAYCLATWDKKADNRRAEPGRCSGRAGDLCGRRPSLL